MHTILALPVHEVHQTNKKTLFPSALCEGGNEDSRNRGELGKWEISEDDVN